MTSDLAVAWVILFPTALPGAATSFFRFFFRRWPAPLHIYCVSVTRIHQWTSPFISPRHTRRQCFSQSACVDVYILKKPPLSFDVTQGLFTFFSSHTPSLLRSSHAGLSLASTCAFFRHTPLCSLMPGFITFLPSLSFASSLSFTDLWCLSFFALFFERREVPTSFSWRCVMHYSSDFTRTRFCPSVYYCALCLRIALLHCILGWGLLDESCRDFQEYTFHLWSFVQLWWGQFLLAIPKLRWLLKLCGCALISFFPLRWESTPLCRALLEDLRVLWLERNRSILLLSMCDSLSGLEPVPRLN